MVAIKPPLLVFGPDGYGKAEELNAIAKAMGTWRANETSPALVLSILYQWLSDKHPNGLYYKDMVELIKQNPKSSVYGDIDLNLLTYGRKFQYLPQSGSDLLSNRYSSLAQ